MGQVCICVDKYRRQQLYLPTHKHRQHFAIVQVLAEMTPLLDRIMRSPVIRSPVLALSKHCDIDLCTVELEWAEMENKSHALYLDIRSLRRAQSKLKKTKLPRSGRLNFISGLLFSLQPEVSIIIVETFLRMHWAINLHQEVTTEQLRLAAQTVFERASAATQLSWRYPRNAIQRKWVDEAYAFIAEYRLVRWILRCNTDYGLTVPLASILRAYLRFWPWSGKPWVTNAAAKLWYAPYEQQKIWAFRFRSRWNLHIGRLKVESKLTATEISTKAAIKFSIWFPPKRPLNNI